MTTSQKELLQYLKDINVKTAAWVAEDPQNRGAGECITDMDFWAEEGIYSIEDYELDGLRAEYCDLHKELYGRKSWPYGGTFEEIESDVKAMRTHMREIIRKEDEEKAKVKAIKDAAFDHTPINNPILPFDFALS